MKILITMRRIVDNFHSCVGTITMITENLVRKSKRRQDIDPIQWPIRSFLISVKTT